MKRSFVFIFLFCFILYPGTALAGFAPLENKSSNHVIIPDTTQVSLVTFYANLRVRTGFTSVNTQMLVKNDGTQEVKLLTGIPAQIDSVRKISKPTVTIEGEEPRIRNPHGDPNPKTEAESMPGRWYTWEVPLKPGESKVIECAFTIDNGLYPVGTEEIFFPFHFLKYWNGPVQYAQVIVDFDFYPTYVFEPQPSILPHQVDEGGRLTWRFHNLLTPEDLIVYFRPIDTLVINFFQNGYPKDKGIGKIIKLFKSKAYQNTISEIDAYMAASPDFPNKNELDFVKALSYLGLYDRVQALNILTRIENNPGFSLDITNTIRNKIIYEKFHILESLKGGEEAYQYLLNVRPTLSSGNPLFLQWVEAQMERLQPPPEIPEEPIEEEEETGQIPKPDESIEEENEKENLIRSVELFGYELPVEYVFLGGLFLLLIISNLFRSRRKKRSGYLFR